MADASAANPEGKLWGSRFSGQADPLMEAFSASVRFDRRLWAADVEGSQAYAQALQEAGLLTAEENRALQAGLDAVAAEWRAQTFALQPGDEDVHTANERRLREIAGAVAGKLHTGRSRNDQVVTDLRLWLRAEIDSVQRLLADLIRVMLAQAETHLDLIMPGFTHLQLAQPTRFSHWLLSHAWPLHRDLDRLVQVRARVNVLPLGSGALAGNPFPVDRKRLADRLRFDDVTCNSMDGVADRDFVAEFLFCASLSMVHLSQLAEDVIIYGSEPYGFVALADAYSTGSSLMPQKKNPDSFELIRGKSGRAAGSLMGLLMVLKGLPRAYNRDLQEDKETLFDAVDTWSASLRIATGALATLVCRGERMARSCDEFMLATDLAEYLVRKGLPFREAHQAAGEAVKKCEQEGRPLSSLQADEWSRLHPLFDADATRALDVEASVESRNVIGATSREAVNEQIRQLKRRLENSASTLRVA